MDQVLAKKIIGSKSVDIQTAKKLWDSFPVKDISLEDFHRELNEVLSPFSAMKELKGIQSKKKMGFGVV